MTDRERVQLLSGPYTPPRLKRGDRATCLMRDRTVVITSISAGRIAWPRCRALDQRGGSGLLVDEELARAVRSESAAAVMYWWGVGVHAVWRWRKALGVGRMDSPGSRRLIQAVAEQGAEGIKRREWTAEERERYRQRAVELDLARFLVAPRLERQWKKAELQLLGTAADAEVAERIGRTTNAVRIMRTRLGVPHPGRQGWTAEEP